MATPVEPGVKVGWLNRHTPTNGFFSSKQQGYHWKLVKASLGNGQLTVSTAPSLSIRAFDPSIEPPAVAPVNLTSGIASSSVDRHLAALSVADGLDLKHKSAEPHPDLVLNPDTLEVAGGSSEALCHYVLFAAAPQEELSAVITTLPFCGVLPHVLAILKEYTDLVASRQLTDPPTPLASRVQLVIHTFLDATPGILLNQASHFGLQQLANSLGTVDEQTSTALKLEIYKCHEFLTGLIKGPGKSTPTESHAKLHILERVQQLAHHGELDIPSELFLDSEFIDVLAHQIAHYHRHLWQRWSPLVDVSLIFHRSGDKNSTWQQNALMFDSQTPHFLGRLLLNHIINSRLSAPKRGALLQQWIVLGEKLHALGDIVGWVGIVTTMCRTPILRLRETWSYVDAGLRARVSDNWAFEAFELDKRAKMDLLAKTTFRASTDDMGEVYPKAWCVPYFGDIIVSSVEKLDYRLVRQIIDRVSGVVEGWNYYFENAPDMDDPPGEVPVEPVFQQLMSRWASMAVTAPDLLLSLEAASLSLEPRILGHYLNYHYNQTLPLSNGSFLPVMFTEVCPGFQLFSRSSLMSAASSYSRGPGSQGSAFSRSAANSPALGSSEPRQRGRANISGPVPLRRPLPTRSNSFPPPTTGNRELELGTREYMMENQSGHVLVKSIRDLLNVGVNTHSADSDLVFKSFGEERHGSRASSIIENLGRRSVLFDSNRLSIQSLELARLQEQSMRPLNVVVKAASLPRLVDVLVLGANEFTPPGQNFVFKLNLPLHTETFFATFRSFCSPLELLSMIRTRFQAVSGAAMSILNRSNDPGEPFPVWKPYPDDVLHNPQAVAIMSQIYTNILEAIQFWESEHFVDFAADNMLRNNALALLNDIKVATSDPVFSDGLQDLARRVHAYFTKQCFQITIPLPDQRTVVKPIGRHLVPLLGPQQGTDNLSALEMYLEELDTLVADLLSKVALQDWMQLFETLELQVSDTTALFNYTWSGSTNDESITIGNIYSYLSSLYRKSPDQPIIEHLPVPIRELIKLHANMADYFCYQVSDPLLHLTGQDRVQRMIQILKMLGILRTRMRFSDLFPDANDTISRVPSFLETAILDGVLRPESRMYNIAWLHAGARVATDFGGFDPQIDELPNSCTIFIPKIPAERLSPKSDGVHAITPCVGWIIERLLEIVCYIPNMAVDTPELINFDKRRYAFNLVNNLQTEFLTRTDLDEATLTRLCSQYDFIVNPDSRLYQWDRKAIRDAAAREASGVAKAMLKQRVFAQYVATEQAKLKAEQRQYDVFVETQAAMPRSTSAYALRERRQSRLARPLSTVGSGPSFNSGSSITVSNSQPASAAMPRGSSRSSRFGGLLRAVRPLSMAFSSSNSSVAPMNGTPPSSSQSSTGSSPSLVSTGSLPDVASFDEAQFRQVLVLDMADWVPKGPGRHSMLRLVPTASTGAGAGEHVFQAQNDRDAHNWVIELENSHRSALALKMSQPGSSKVFGVPLEIVAAREQRNIPIFFETLLSHIEKFGLDDVGLYRISGSVGAINSLKAAFDNGETVSDDDDRMADVNAVAGCVKLYLRELPESLLTTALFSGFIQCGSIAPESARIVALKNEVQQLPASNYAVLSRLMSHLAKVVEHESANKMSVPNLAIVFSMNFLPPSEVDGMKAMQSIVKTMIQNAGELFSS